MNRVINVWSYIIKTFVSQKNFRLDTKQDSLRYEINELKKCGGGGRVDWLTFLFMFVKKIPEF